MDFARLKRRIVHMHMLCVLGLSLVSMAAHATPTTPSVSATILPKRFVRQYDPITVVFSHSVRPKNAVFAQQGERFLRIRPQRSGVYRWINSKTLEFRPSMPWPGFSRIGVHVPQGVTASVGQLQQAQHRVLRTLLPRPRSMYPRPGSRDARNVRRIQLTFDQVLPVRALRKALRVSVGSFSGTGTKIPMSSADWWVKKIPSARTSKKRYVILFKKELPKAKTIAVQLRLALPAKRATLLPVWSASFRTMVPFRIQEVQCAKTRLTVAWGQSQYNPERALNCGGGYAAPTLLFSRPLHPETNPGKVRQHIRISPTVAGVKVHIRGHRVILKGAYRRDTLYRLVLEGSGPTIRDTAGQHLQHSGKQTFFFYLSQKKPFLRWQTSQGIIERFGPQMMPILARSIQKVDIRIYPIHEQDRRFWPFPRRPLQIDENQRVPHSGTMKKHASRTYLSDASKQQFQRGKLYCNRSCKQNKQEWYTQLKKHIRWLGTPIVSRIVNIPRAPKGQTQLAGLDLSKHLRSMLPWNTQKTAIAHRQSNQFLVGLRLLDGSSIRRFIRVQVTDLSLTSIEEKEHVVFAVSSIKTGRPLSQAQISIEGYKHPKDTMWSVLWKGRTNAQGWVRFSAGKGISGYPLRVRVRYGEDRLILDPTLPPMLLKKGVRGSHWSSTTASWLSWTRKHVQNPVPDQFRAHVFTERPVYRPKEPVYIKGIVRELKQGKLTLPNTKKMPSLRLLLQGPKQRRWVYDDIQLSKMGSFHKTFLPKNAPLGRYTAELKWMLNDGRTHVLSIRRFKIEAYKLPLFAVQLFGKRKVRADKSFRVAANAKYYAGGFVLGRAVKWRVTEQAIRYRPKNRKGFIFSSKLSYSRSNQSTHKLVLQQTTQLSNKGQTHITLDPTKSFDLQARRYTIEATVKGPDGRSVSGYKSIRVLPPFAIGVRIPQRFKLQGKTIKTQLIAVGIHGQNVPGIQLKSQLFRREWHAQLMETDFVQGKAQYKTEVVDTPVGQCTAQTQNKAVGCTYTASKGGVYVLRVQARDKMGRLQTVEVDMFVKGKQAVAWERPRDHTFKLNLDKKMYRVGEQAHILVRSPFQNARALVIIEDPTQVRYHWQKIKKGQAVITLPIESRFAPALSVHAVLMQGRVAPPQAGGLDPGKPRTAIASVRIPVTAQKNRVMLAMHMPKKARPRQNIAITLHLRTPSGHPLSGEVTLWAVDRAALSLGREGRLNPLHAFVKERRSYLRIRDSRNAVIGRIRQRAERSGGGGGGAGGRRVIVRKNFKTIAYYNPSIHVGPSGKVTVHIQLPDDLTTFAVRAVAVSGAKRFGYTSRNLRVRLPVIIQRALPRFVRPGDQIISGGLARVIEGKGGLAHAQVRVSGLQIRGALRRKLTLPNRKARPVFFDMKASTVFRQNVSIQMSIRRQKDGAMDAFQVQLPVRPKQRRVYMIREQKVSSMNSVVSLLSNWPEAIQAGSGRVEVLVATNNSTLKAAAALGYLMEYPFGCTEQRVSRAFPMLVYQDLFKKSALQYLTSKHIQTGITSTLTHIRDNIGREGGWGYWPSAHRSLWLTAYTTRFILEAQKSGYAYPTHLLEKSLRLLRRSLRSDFGWNDRSVVRQTRAEALLTLAQAGRHEPAYLRRLFRQRKELRLYTQTRLLLAMELDRPRHIKRIRRLSLELRNSVRVAPNSTQLSSIRYKKGFNWYNALLSSPTRTIAALLEGLAPFYPKSKEVAALKRALLDQRVGRVLGAGWQKDEKGLSWGSTQNNARALLALRMFMKHKKHPLPTVRLAYQLQTRIAGILRWNSPVVQKGQRAWSQVHATDAPTGLRFLGSKHQGPLWVRVRLSYVPQKPAQTLTALNRGLSVQRSTTVLASKKNSARYFELKAGLQKSVHLGQILEEKVRIISPKRQHHVVLEVPIAAGLELLNPNLKTSSSEAKTTQANSIRPSHIEHLDDRIRFFFNVLPAGDHAVYFRTRAVTLGRYSYPSAHAQKMYNPTHFGRGVGYTLSILPTQ